VHSPAIDTRVLYWSCIDATNLVAAVVKQSLDAWHASSQTYHERTVVDHAYDAIQLGLSVWSVTSQSQVTTTCSALENQRRQHPQVFLLVFLASELAEYRGLMIEAGANYVVLHICQLQTVLLRVLDRLPVCPAGHHPLTSGLLNRLPWS
jgi:hypothetical protein